MQSKTKTYKIEQTVNTNRYTLYLEKNPLYMYELYQSITKTNILSYALFDDDDQDQDNQESISFTAETVKPLSTFLQKGKLTNQLAIKMIHDLSKQIAYLETNLLAFYGYNLDDILIINDDTFFIATTKCMINIDATNKCLYFYKPIIKSYFSSPELNELTKLPARLDYRSSYYSLGALILFCSTNIYIFSELKEIDEILLPINYTKLYWFLKRCFHEDSKQRILLFI
jgi:hypothetical protein